MENKMSVEQQNTILREALEFIVAYDGYFIKNSPDSVKDVAKEALYEAEKKTNA